MKAHDAIEKADELRYEAELMKQRKEMIKEQAVKEAEGLKQKMDRLSSQHTSESSHVNYEEKTKKVDQTVQAE